ncbi:MAG TPA: hypothetical protein VN228_04150 [Pyrinomonadaceae bacterium]|nr:hypothetical protein [Pyrinomonadaceae bacterium]
MKLNRTLRRLILPVCFTLFASVGAHAQTLSGNAGYRVPVTLGNESNWLMSWGVAVQLRQVAPNQVQVFYGWRIQGFATYPVPPYRPTQCYPSQNGTWAINSRRAYITLNGNTFDTANGTLSTTILPGYGVDYYGTFNGNIASLGTSASMYLDATVTVQTPCGSSLVYMSPSYQGVNLQSQ